MIQYSLGGNTPADQGRRAAQADGRALPRVGDRVRIKQLYDLNFPYGPFKVGLTGTVVHLPESALDAVAGGMDYVGVKLDEPQQSIREEFNNVIQVQAPDEAGEDDAEAVVSRHFWEYFERVEG